MKFDDPVRNLKIIVFIVISSLLLVVIGFGYAVPKTINELRDRNILVKPISSYDYMIKIRYSDINEWIENLGKCRCVYNPEYAKRVLIIFEDGYDVAHVYYIKPFDRGFLDV